MESRKDRMLQTQVLERSIGASTPVNIYKSRDLFAMYYRGLSVEDGGVQVDDGGLVVSDGGATLSNSSASDDVLALSATSE